MLVPVIGSEAELSDNGLADQPGWLLSPEGVPRCLPASEIQQVRVACEELAEAAE